MDDGNVERNLGEQPIASLMASLDLKSHDLVAASTQQISHKMIVRACKGRRLKPGVKLKILQALSAASGKEFRIKELFNY